VVEEEEADEAEDGEEEADDDDDEVEEDDEAEFTMSRVDTSVAFASEAGNTTGKTVDSWLSCVN
jgi:hypothetical protein